MQPSHQNLDSTGPLWVADVIVLKMTRSLDQWFTYGLPRALIGLIQVGSKVVVPFGAGDATHEAIVVDLRIVSNEGSDSCAHKVPKFKDVLSVCDSAAALDERRVALALWIRDRYLTNYAQAISLLLPSGTTMKRDYKLLPGFETKSHEVSGPGEAEAAFLEWVAARQPLQSELNEAQLKLMKQCEKKKTLIRQEHLTTAVRQRQRQFYRLVEPAAVNQLLEQIPVAQTVKRGVLEALRDYGRLEASRLRKEWRATAVGLKKMEDAGWIVSENEEAFHFPDYYDSGREHRFVALSEEQKTAFDRMSASVLEGSYKTFLLHGVTGSGKTEVYMELADLAIAQKKQVILLVPEISLTPQLVDRFRRRFGDRIAILHSRMSALQRFDQWRAIGRGDYDIVIGARSAIFAPCESLGLIVVDEAHDSSYKSDQTPKYHAVDVARRLSELHGAPLILGSATPGIEQYYEARSGQAELVELRRRFSQVALPKVEVVDMRLELMAGNRSMFSQALESAILEALHQGQQIMLLLNRKGYHTFISCRSCGYALKCPNCDVSLIFHKGQNHARCSYCQYRMGIPTSCPECGSRYFKFFGSGTEKVEEAFLERFGNVAAARMDSEVLSRKGALEEILTDFESGKTQVLIGTQLISKGLDFANVGLVGVILADVTLNLPDYQASERTFQLLTQVSGRSGRASTRGRVIVQTYAPEHFAVLRAADHDYLGFYEEEMQLRKAFGYPPYKQMANLMISGLKPDRVESGARSLSDWLSVQLTQSKLAAQDYELLGPSPAVYSKIKNRYRWQIIIKYKEEALPKLEEILRQLPQLGQEIRCTVDIRAVSVL